MTHSIALSILLVTLVLAAVILLMVRVVHALSGAPKLELDGRLKQIYANRIGVASDCLALERATPSTWGGGETAPVR